LLIYEYDKAGNLVRATDVHNTTLSFAYDAGNRMTRRTDRRGYAFHFKYDDQGRCIHSRGDDGLLEVFLTFDPEARTTFVRRGDGGQWIYFYNEARAITQITDPYGFATLYVQDDLGRTVQEIDPNGNVTQLHYNELGQHDYRIDPNGYVLPTREADPNPRDPLAYRLPDSPMQWEFGHLLTTKAIKPLRADDDVLGQFPAPVFNAFLGKSSVHESTILTRTEHGAGAETSVANEFDQPLEHSGPGFTERWKYDSNGNPIEHQDRDGAIWRSEYVSWNALAKEFDPLGHVTAYQHTVQGLVAKVTDPGGTVSEYEYDLKEKLVAVRRHGRVRERYRRDKAGNIVEKRDAAGRTLVSWEIGPANVDLVRTLASGEKHVFQHDDRGRITSAETPAGKIEFSYDAYGQILSDLRDGKGVVHEFEYLELVTTTYFEKFKVSYQVEDNGDVTVSDPVGGSHRFQRSKSGLIAKHLANGDRELCQYDGGGRCLRKALVRSASGGAPWMRSFAYTATGDLVAASDTVRGLTRYSYDGAHRLAQEVLPDGTSRRFAFDAAGNLHAQPGLSNVVMDSGNRLAEAKGARFTYNERDHLCQRTGSRGATRYEYNDLDLLVRVDVNGSEWTATYDAYCRRVTKTWHGQTTTYYWDDFRLAAEVRHDGSVRIYVYANETALVPFVFVEYTGLDAEPDSGQRYYLYTNPIGVPIRVEDADGSVCWTARIDPFGLAEVSMNSTLEMPLRFPGHYFDAETGLHYNRFRYFSPELGRFLQSDPAGINGGINFYAYPVDPLTDSDIDGLGKTERRRNKDQDKRNGPKDEGTGSKAQQCVRDLKDMTDEELQAHCKRRADELAAQMTNPRDRQGVTIAVTVVQKKGKPETRRVIVTTSTDDGKLPAGVGPLKPNERVPHPAVPILRQRNETGDDGKPMKKGVTKHPQPTAEGLGQSSEPPGRMGTATAVNPRKETVADNDKTGEKGTEPYDKRTPQNPNGRSDHHAEQRAVNGKKDNEEVVAMSPGDRPCCPGCRNALGENGLSKVPPDRRGDPPPND